MKKLLSFFIFSFSLNIMLTAQNPICPIGTYIADPTARVWADGKLYIYGSTDENPGYYCSYRHDVMFTSDLAELDDGGKCVCLER
jgi:arabinoxylan arabinofuranohydrolase